MHTLLTFKKKVDYLMYPRISSLRVSQINDVGIRMFVILNKAFFRNEDVGENLQFVFKKVYLDAYKKIQRFCFQ